MRKWTANLRRRRDLLLKYNSKHPFADAIKREVFGESRGVNILIVGKTQTRKSTVSIALAMLICYRFLIEKHMAIMDVKPLLNIFNNIKLFRGDVVIADDFGVGMNHREWHNFLHKALNLSMMTHGFKGLVVIVNVPYQSYIDKDARLLFDYEITTIKPHDNERYVKVKIEKLQHVEVKPGQIDTYKHYLRMLMPDGTIQMVRSFNIKYPPQEIMDRYFELANEKKKKLQFDLNAEADTMMTKETQKHFALDWYVDEVIKRKPEFTTIWQGRESINLDRIKNEFKVGGPRAKQIQAGIYKKLESLNANIQEGHGTADNTGTSPGNDKQVSG